MLLSSMFREAVPKGFVSLNPCREGRVTTPKVIDKEGYYCTPEQVQRLVKALEREPIVFRAMVLLYLNTGMRKSELHGLRWDDFNAESGMLRIERQLQYIDRQGLTLRDTKTERSIRSIKLPPSLCALLNKWREEQANWKAAAGTDWATGYGRENPNVTGATLNTPWMFTDEYGNPRHPGSFQKRFKAFLKRAGFTEEEVKQIHVHTLRHTNASILIASNVNLTTVSNRLGDAAQTIQRVYAHALKRADEEAAEVLDVALTAAASVS